jgi:hypothetical protein
VALLSPRFGDWGFGDSFGDSFGDLLGIFWGYRIRIFTCTCIQQDVLLPQDLVTTTLLATGHPGAAPLGLLFLNGRQSNSSSQEVWSHVEVHEEVVHALRFGRWRRVGLVGHPLAAVIL